MSQDQAVAAPSRTSTFRNELNDAVGINARNPRALGATFQGRELCGHGEGLFEQGFAVRKVEIINDINEEQGDGGRIRGIAM